jgi:hypothetical protein
MENQTRDDPQDRGNEPQDPDTSTRTFRVLAIILLLMSLPIASLAVLAWFQTRPAEGQLVLTRTGCQALEYHGATVRYLEDASACGIDTRFRINFRTRLGQIFIQTDQGTLEVELSGSEVVSLAYR